MMPSAQIAVNYPLTETAILRFNVAPGITNPRKQFFALSPGRAGVFQTAEQMAACVRGEIGPDYAGAKSQAVIALGREVQAMFFGQSYPEAVFNFVHTCIRYVQHPFDLQIVQDALVTVAEGEADCVSMSVLVATLLASQDWPVWFVLQDPEGREYTHVYCETLIDGKFVALDPVSSNPIGWRQQLPAEGFETTWPIYLR